MALPVTITGISTAVAPVGPFKTSGIISAGATIYSIATGGGFYGQFGNSIAAAAFQSFTVSAGATVGSVIFQLSKTGTPTDNLTATIYAADGSNQPTGSVLGTSNTVSGTFTIGLVEFTFATPVTLASAGKYTAVLKRTTIDDANCYRAHHGNNDFDATQSHGYGDIGSWTIPAYDIYLIVKAAPTVLPDAYYFFGRDGTTATTLQAYKATDPAGSTPLIDTLSGTASGRQVGTSATYTQLSQSFTTVGAFNLKSVGVSLAKIGSPADNILADVYAASGGLPTGSSLGQATALAASSVAASQTEYTLTWVTPVALSAATQYCIVLSRSGAVNSSNNIAWGGQSGSSSYSGGFFSNYNGSVWSADVFILESTLKVYDVIPTAWSSIATKTGFTTAILRLDAYQVGKAIHLLVQDGTASTALATKYVSFDAATDTFLATTETVSAAVAVTGQVAGVGAGASLVVRSNGNVVAFYNGVQTKTSGTFRARVYTRTRTALNTWTSETSVDGGAGAVDNVLPIAVLGSADLVHFIWGSPTNVNNRTLDTTNSQYTATTSASLTSPGDAVSYNRSGTIKVVVTSNGTGQTVQRFDSATNPTFSYATPTAANATLPHRIGVDTVTNDVTIVYRNSADSDIYAIKSSDDGATFGTAVSFFVGTVASADANVSRSSSGSLYTRAGYDVVGYIVNDNGTWKYNEYVVRAPATADAWNVNDKSAATVLSNGDKTANNSSGSAAVRSTTKRLNGAAGKYYAEIQTVTRFAISSCNVGIKDASAAVSGTPFAARVNGFGDIYIGDTYSGITLTAPVDGGIISLAWDTGAELFWARTTNNWNDNVANDPATGVGGIDFSSAAAVNHALWSQNGTFTIRTEAAELTQATPSGFLSWMGESLSTNVNYSDTITPAALPIAGQDIVGVYVGSVAYADTITASALPIVGATITPVYSVGYNDTITPSALPIGGAIRADDVFASRDTIAPSALPVVGATFTPVYTARYSDTLTAGTLPITGQTITPVYSAGNFNYTDSIEPAALPLVGAAIAPFYSTGYNDSIAPAALPVIGATFTPVYTARYSDTVTSGTLPIAGATITPLYTVRYSDTIAAGALPVAGQTITPIFSAGAINYTDSITPTALPITGATITAVFSVGYNDTIAPSAVPIAGAAPVDLFARSDTIAPSAVPIVGQTITPFYTARYTDTITAGVLPITGAAITPVFSAGAIYYTDTIAPSSVPLVGATINPVSRTNYADSIAPAAVPVAGSAIFPIYTARYADTIAAAGVPLVGSTLLDRFARSEIFTGGLLPIAGQPITPVFTVGVLTGKTWVKVGGVWKQPTTYVNAGGAWTPPIASYVKDGGVWKQI